MNMEGICETGYNNFAVIIINLAKDTFVATRRDNLANQFREPSSKQNYHFSSPSLLQSKKINN